MGHHPVLHVLKPVGFIAAISSGVQGIIWACFYLAGLLTHYCVIRDDSASIDFSSYVAVYIQGPRCKHTNLFCVSSIAPNQLPVWLVLGIISNLLLCTISIILFIVLAKSIKDKYYGFINTWLVMSCFTIIIDVGLSVLFITDLSKFSNSPCMANNKIGPLATFALFMFTSRGILLTVYNICFIVFFVIASCQLRRKVMKNSEMDLTSNWPSTSDSSYDFGPAHGDREDLFGVVNPIQETSYPNYTAKSRWPSLQRNFNTVPHQHLRTRNDNDYLPPRLVRADYHMKNNDLYESSYPPKANGLFQQRQLQQTDSSKKFNQDAILCILTNPETGRNTSERSRTAQEQIQSRDDYEIVSAPINTSNAERNRKISRPNNRYESKTVPSKVSTAPVPPPLPPLKLPSNNVNSQGNNERNSNSKKLQMIDPDYTPVTQRKTYDINSPFPANQPVEAFPFNNVPKGLPTVDEQRARFQMTLHEAIKSRPPLRPVLQRMSGVTDC